MSTTNIREFMKHKQMREKQNSADYMQKIKMHRRTIFYRILAIVLVFAVIGIVISVKYNSHIYTSYEVVSRVERAKVQSAVDVRLDTSVLSYSKDGAYCMDEKGNVMWNQTYEMQNPILATCQNVAAIGEYNGSTIYVADTQQQLGEIKTDLPIKDICVAANGVVAAVLEDADTTWIYVYDKDGKVLVYFKTRMVQSGYPIAMSLSPNAKLMAVSYLYVDVGSMRSSVAFYNFDSVGQSQTDRYMSGYNYDNTVVPFVKFVSNDTAIAVGDNRLMVYKGSQKPESSSETLLSEEVQSVYWSDKYIGLVYYNDSSEANNLLDIYDTNGNKVEQKEFSIDYTDIFFEQDRYVIYNPNESMICTMSGTEKYSGTFEEQISVMVPTKNNYKYTLVTENGMEIIQLK